MITQLQVEITRACYWRYIDVYVTPADGVAEQCLDAHVIRIVARQSLLAFHVRSDVEQIQIEVRMCEIVDMYEVIGVFCTSVDIELVDKRGAVVFGAEHDLDHLSMQCLAQIVQHP